MPPPDRYSLERAFLALDYPAGVHWTARSPVDQGISGGWARDTAALNLAAKKQDGWNFYISLNQPSPDFRGSKPSKKDIAVFGCVGIDIDLNPDTYIDEVDSTLTNIIMDMKLPPTACRIIFSGKGCWIWILVAHTILANEEAAQEYDQLLKGYVRHFAHDYAEDLAPYGIIDTTCGDLSRIARCPGTIHQGAKKMATIKDVYFEDDDADESLDHLMRISNDDFVKYAKPFVQEVPNTPVAPLPADVSHSAIITRLNVTSRQFVLFGVAKEDESRHRRLWSTATNMRELGISKELARPLLERGVQACRPKLAPVTLDRTMTQVWGKS